MGAEGGARLSTARRAGGGRMGAEGAESPLEHEHRQAGRRAGSLEHPQALVHRDVPQPHRLVHAGAEQELRGTGRGRGTAALAGRSSLGRAQQPWQSDRRAGWLGTWRAGRRMQAARGVATTASMQQETARHRLFLSLSLALSLPHSHSLTHTHPPASWTSTGPARPACGRCTPCGTMACSMAPRQQRSMPRQRRRSPAQLEQGTRLKTAGWLASQRGPQPGQPAPLQRTRHSTHTAYTFPAAHTPVRPLLEGCHGGVCQQPAAVGPARKQRPSAGPARAAAGGAVV